MEEALEKKILNNKNYQKFIDLDLKKHKKFKTKKIIKITKPRSKSTIRYRSKGSKTKKMKVKSNK